MALFSSVQFSRSVVSVCDPIDYSTPGLPVHHQLLELTNSCPSSRWRHPTISSFVVPFSSCPQSFPALGSFLWLTLFIRSTLCIRWPKYWSFSFSISPSNEYSGLISFRIDWFDLLAVLSRGLSDSQESSPTPQFKKLIIRCSIQDCNL